MNDEYIKGYREGYINAIDTQQNVKHQMFGMDLGKVLEIVSNHMEEQEKVKMSVSLKYQWCEPDAKTDREFLGWIYQRLNNKGDSYADVHMRRLDKIIDSTIGVMPTKKRTCINVTNDDLVVIKRNGKTVYED